MSTDDRQRGPQNGDGPMPNEVEAINRVEDKGGLALPQQRR